MAHVSLMLPQPLAGEQQQRIKADSNAYLEQHRQITDKKY
jgi:hypothetical protein